MNAAEIQIRKLNEGEQIPYELLLLSDDTVEAIDKNLNKGNLYIGEYENKVIAAFILKEIEIETIEIKNIAVLEYLQGKGVGTILLSYIIEKAKMNAYKKLIVGTCDQCVKEVEFYEKSGFRIYDLRKDFFIDNYPKAIFENGIQIKDMVMLSMSL